MRQHGRSRGGLTIEIDALDDANGLSIALKLTGGQARDGCGGVDMLSTLGQSDVPLAHRA